MGTAVPTMEKRVKNRIGKIEIAGQIIDREAMELARQQWDSVAKPLNSLGKLEELIIQIAGIQKTPHVKKYWFTVQITVLLQKESANLTAVSLLWWLTVWQKEEPTSILWLVRLGRR